MVSPHLKKAYIDLLVIAIGFTAIAFFSGIYFLYALAALALIAGSTPKSALFVSGKWRLFGKVWGKLNAYIILTIFFILIICPVGMISRWFGPKDQKKGWKWVEKPTDFTKPW